MIIAVDPSLTATGLAVLSPSTDPEPYWAVHTVRSSAPVAPADPALAQLRRMERIAGATRRSIQELTYGVKPVFGVLEAPAFSKGNGMAHERAGLWWMLYQVLAGHGIPVLVVKPNLRAKYATGNGGAGKDEVLLAASRRYPEVLFKTNHEADAVILAAIGARVLGMPIEKSLSKTHLDALRTLM